MVKLFPLIILVVMLQGCNRAADDIGQKVFDNASLTNSLFFSDSVWLSNKRFSDAVASYLKESNNVRYKYFTLFLGQYKDTVISVLSPLWYDLGVGKENPVGVLIVDEKVIFLTSSVLNVIGNKQSSQVQKMYDKAVLSLSDHQPTKSRKSVLFKIPIYSDTLIVSQDLNILKLYFMPEIHEDTLYN
jgi:hypothetical protein